MKKESEIQKELRKLVSGSVIKWKKVLYLIAVIVERK